MNIAKIMMILSVLIIEVAAQETITSIKSNVPVITIRDGKNLKEDFWRLDPDINPDIYRADLIEGRSQQVVFITDVDSISFMVEEGKTYDFIIEFGDSRCYTQIIGQRFTPAAIFDSSYQASHRGKIFIEIPEVYELVNVAIAISSFGIGNKNFVYQNSPYYAEVRKRFDAYKDQEFVVILDSILNQNSGYYATFKMNGNAFKFGDQGKIVQSRIYDRTGFRNERVNSLHPYITEMQSFADESGFREFYRVNKETYQTQIAFFRDTVDISEMKDWLDRNFPEAEKYDTYKIVFSPLVAFNQSTTWFESNGFTELQPHVNFPYRSAIRRLGVISQEAEITYRGNIVFTEINHGYINPEAAKYANRISRAISNRNILVDNSRSSSYYRGIAVFNEYLNWGLVSLRILDYVPKHEQEKLISNVEQMMVQNRYFTKFDEFNRFLIDLYISKKRDMTLAVCIRKLSPGSSRKTGNSSDWIRKVCTQSDQGKTASLSCRGQLPETI